MKTATVRDLRNQYRQVLAWVEAGEDVVISRRGKPIARLIPERPKPRIVDWSKSPALKLPTKGVPRLTAKQAADLIADAQGRY